MPKRVKHDKAQQRFDLNIDNTDEKALDDFLTALANHGRKSSWIIEMLVKAYKDRFDYKGRSNGTQSDDQSDTSGTEGD